MDTEMQVDRVVRGLIGDYVRRAHTLRQIHSNKGSVASTWSRRYVIFTVALATVVTVFGFVGIGRMTKAISKVEPVSEGLVEAAYSLVVLAILVTTILGLVYRFDERSVRHYHSIETLTEFIRDYEDLITLSRNRVRILSVADLTEARVRYKGILVSLPPNTDKEYLEAKKSEQHKKAAKGKPSGVDTDDSGWSNASSVASVDNDLGRALAGLMTDPMRLPIVATVRDVLGEEFWLTGGAVREAVWDELHKYKVPTPTDDIDIIYFDPQNPEERAEEEYASLLRAVSANVRWSVKNEARMHALGCEEPYESIEDAISKFPETATSVAVRLDREGRIQILAPHGLEDLFNLVVRPTVGFDLSRYESRLAAKSWTEKWPLLQINGSNAQVGSSEE